LCHFWKPEFYGTPVIPLMTRISSYSRYRYWHIQLTVSVIFIWISTDCYVLTVRWNRRNDSNELSKHRNRLGNKKVDFCKTHSGRGYLKHCITTHRILLVPHLFFPLKFGILQKLGILFLFWHNLFLFPCCSRKSVKIFFFPSTLGKNW